MNLLWKCKHRYRFVSCVHGTAWLQLSVPRHIARLFFIVYAVIDRIATTSQVELGAELSGLTAKFWTFWRRSFSPFVVEQSDVFLFAFQFTAAVTVLNAHFQIYWKVSQQNIVTLLPHLSLIQINFCNSRLKKNERQTT